MEEKMVYGVTGQSPQTKADLKQPQNVTAEEKFLAALSTNDSAKLIEQTYTLASFKQGFSIRGAWKRTLYHDEAKVVPIALRAGNKLVSKAGLRKRLKKEGALARHILEKVSKSPLEQIHFYSLAGTLDGKPGTSDAELGAALAGTSLFRRGTFTANIRGSICLLGADSDGTINPWPSEAKDLTQWTYLQKYVIIGMYNLAFNKKTALVMRETD